MSGIVALPGGVQSEVSRGQPGTVQAGDQPALGGRRVRRFCDAGVTAGRLLDELPGTRGVAAGRRRGSPQLFFEVYAMKPPSCGTTFVPLHFGHRTFAFSRSLMVIISSNPFLHF